MKQQLKIDIDELGKTIANNMPVRVDQKEELWTSSECASYLKNKSAVSFVSNVAALPSFPKPVELPSLRSSMRCGKRLWIAAEVIQWALSHQLKA